MVVEWNCTSEGMIADPVLRRMVTKLAKHCKAKGYKYADLSYVESCANITVRAKENEPLKAEWRFMK